MRIIKYERLTDIVDEVNILLLEFNHWDGVGKSDSVASHKLADSLLRRMSSCSTSKKQRRKRT